MSRFDVEWDNSEFTMLTTTGFDEIAEEALNKCAPILTEATKEACRSVIAHGGDSELVESWKANKPKETKNRDAFVLTCSPKGNSRTHYYHQDGRGGHYNRKYPVSNALKAIWLENGTYRQTAKPFLETASRSCEAEVTDIITKTFHEKVGAE